MSDEYDESDANTALAYMKAQCQVNGVSAIKVEDGEMFMFSRQLVDQLIEKLDSTGQENIIVFVKSGGQLQKV